MLFRSGQLYGSVSARDIVEALEAEGAKVSKSQIVLARPIKAIGLHDVKVALHPEVSVDVRVNVARSPEEADLQAQGVDVMAQMFERETTAFTEDFVPGAEPGIPEDVTAGAPAAAEAAAGEGAADDAPAAETADADEGEQQA